MPCPCCGEWPCARDMAEDEAKWEAQEEERRQFEDADRESLEESELRSLEATPEGQDWTPMRRESPDDLGDWPDMELGEAEDGAF